ncbi:hypothetical protein QJS04_geneDACA006002 [Acorus gramineus]|uniref:Uncharacterized protein n=1 Tax=Acorus gramineus TaxID=55184 RepID=A0AAV9B602_ACOGR|nr:hypothetical protein QJS04_geneDACA006002 [Acorus gramineus]
MEVYWSDLPKDLLFSIASRTEHLFDYIRFGAVCKSWRSAVTVNPRPLHLRFPLLFACNRRDYFLYSPFECKLHPIKLPSISVGCLGSSSNGWVCMLRNDLDIYLFNPFSNSEVLLPPLRTDFISELIPLLSVRKAVWSAEPTDPNCIVVLLYDEANGVVYCRPGDVRWTMFKISLGNRFDAIFFNNKNLYVVDCRSGRVAAVDLHRGREMTVAEGRDGFCDGSGKSRYLVAGPSGPLLVVRHMKNMSETRRFELFELDGTLKKWVETKSLDEGMLFLGMNTSIWVSSSNLKGCKGNSIYFMHYNTNLGIFYLEDGSFGSMCGLPSHYSYEWVVPIP